MLRFNSLRLFALEWRSNYYTRGSPSSLYFPQGFRLAGMIDKLSAKGQFVTEESRAQTLAG
jgi:hypothetical protein